MSARRFSHQPTREEAVAHALRTDAVRQRSAAEQQRAAERNDMTSPCTNDEVLDLQARVAALERELADLRAQLAAEREMATLDEAPRVLAYEPGRDA